MPSADSLNQARVLLERGRAGEARTVLAAAMAGGLDGAQCHSLMGFILHQLGDLPGCARALKEAVRLAPDDGAAQFALASISFKLGDEAGAEAATRKAIALGMDDSHSATLLGRILNKQNRLVEAEEAWRKAVRFNPASPQAQRELAELVWMQTGDIAQARAALDAAPQSPEIVAVTVRLLEAAGEDRAAYDLASARACRDPSLHIVAARAGLRIDPQASDRHLEKAPRDNSPARAKAEIEVDLALGRIDQAVRRGEALRAARPSDQHAIALLATACRLAGDARYHALYDYERLVKTAVIDPPPGWTNLDGYLSDLGQALDRIHGPLTHPVGQSLRHGSQTMRGLADYPDAPVRALFTAIDAPIRKHMAAIGADGDYRIASAWSVRLNSGGFHLNHVHPEGWLSSAFYVRTPREMPGNEGWLKFGEPGPPTAPPLTPDHLVKPQAGMLVLFPAYMWHGTVPFSSSDKRLSCAFDIVRA
jgi:tetratricopeptide (TPR) repeat protein